MRDKLLRSVSKHIGIKYKFVLLPLAILFFVLSFVSRIGFSADLNLLNYDTPISMDFKDVSLKDLLKVFSIQSGINFIASEALQDRKITLYLDKVPVKEAMDQLFKANNLSYDYDEISNIIIVKDWGKPQIEMITKVYVLKYASVSTSSIRAELKNYLSGSAVLGGSTTAGTTGAAGAGGAGGEDVGITAAIKKILSENGKVIEDSRTNSLIISDIPSRFSIIEATIARLDVPMPQVMLEVEMLDVSKNLVDKLGFEFSNNPFTLILPGGFMRQGAQFWMGESAHRESEGAVTLGKTFYQTLDFIRTQTDTKYLARPRLLTLNNETAEIRITTNESIGVKTTTSTTGGLTTAEPERSETGVLLRVTPQVNTETGEITMFIYPQVSEATGGNPLTSANDTFTFRDPEVRSTKSMVKVKDGETVIVGGLIRNEFSQVSKKIPILGDIPVIGLLFRHKGATGDKNRERELLVFITPHIIKESQMELAQTYMPKKVLLEREQQPSESTTERKKSITATLNNFVK